MRSREEKKGGAVISGRASPGEKNKKMDFLLFVFWSAWEYNYTWKTRHQEHTS
jgi:hypothetical protein